LADFEVIVRRDPTLQEAKKELAFIRAALGSDSEGSDEDSEEEYPAFSDMPWASHSDSDTPDCKHTGVRDVPCRFYNRGGCIKGTECEYSHAADDKSVRDEL
jgi:hypothetical protein